MSSKRRTSSSPVTQELRIKEAAGLLGVSQPFVVKLLESGKIPYHLTGRQRRTYLKDLIVYKEDRSDERRDALERMGREAEELGLYDRVLLPDE